MKKRGFANILPGAVLLILLLAFTAFAAGCGGSKKEPAPLPQATEQTKQDEGKKPEKPAQKTERKEKETPAASAAKASYTMRDVKNLKHTENFARGALEHIFDGTINKKGKATGYHYSGIRGSKGKIIEGTRSRTDKNGVFTGKVEVSGVQKNGYSSFYPETWAPQEVVDAINRAYKDAMGDTKNPRGTLWIGHDGKLEIDMYLTDDKKILTAYPIYREK